MKLSAHGIETELLAGWEGRISVRRPSVAVPSVAVPSVAVSSDASANRAMDRATAPAAQTHPVVHLANFALPEQRGDFGSGAVDRMGSGHALVVLFEYGPESVGQALFRRQGLPARLRPDMFSGSALQRTIPGQAGAQVFFTEADRAFCLYVVLGRHRDAPTLVPTVNRTLSATRISRR
jgi:hypothetical protein